MSKEVYFVQHCDDENCTLGTLEFGCPICNKNNVNYDNFYDDDKLYRGEIIELRCEHCKENLIIERIDYENIIKSK